MIPKLPLLLLIRKRDIVVVANDATEAFMSISWATFMHPACWQKTLRSVRTTWQMKTAAYIQSRDRKWGTWWLGNPFIFATCKGKKTPLGVCANCVTNLILKPFFLLTKERWEWGLWWFSTVMTSNEQVENGWTVGDKQGRLKYMMIFLTIDGGYPCDYVTIGHFRLCLKFEIWLCLTYERDWNLNRNAVQMMRWFVLAN